MKTGLRIICWVMLIIGGFLIGHGITDFLGTAEVEVRGTPPNKSCCEEKSKEVTKLQQVTSEAQAELDRTRKERIQIEIISIENRLVQCAKEGRYRCGSFVESGIVDAVEAYFKERGFDTKRTFKDTKNPILLISWGKGITDSSDDSNPDRVLESDSQNDKCPK